MARGRVEIKRIDDPARRKLTLNKRHTGLLKKAHELSVLCDVEVAFIIFPRTGKHFEYASSSMMKILERYFNCLEALQHAAEIPKRDKTHDRLTLEWLNQRMKQLEHSCRQLSGDDLNCLSMDQLHQLEQIISLGLQRVRAQQDQLMREQLQQHNMKEQLLLEKHEKMSQKLAEIQAFLSQV